ncbi:hypothetical protein CRU87_00860 [Aliarcobacter trophiarum LMG 25534]|uniref:Uncharacterized protein n=1 Tax=Aliarcobacter trophiarum LMG 25534 TaxID=1032241 RepID=A0AAD0VLS8_9BACT|nr:hypothetical protein [Aliarcobacter trophiarum]AXK48256.1 hypothetical protein ATR_0371 [Aliarcobacter trophiarum LMG 25534]RXI28522.1 hypothetical protein CRU89_00790 [Aliarcobacter trophiarum]RXJ93069.1 hypothetical protein CRU87_00860 [Aliarcobacter trophiarum LMG 25534]
MSLAIIYELRAADVKEEHIEQIMDKIKNRLSEENIDKELVKLGYPKIFTVDYDDYDNFDYDDSFTPNSKSNFEEE